MMCKCNVIRQNIDVGCIFGKKTVLREKRRFCKRVEKVLQTCFEHSYTQSDVSMYLDISGQRCFL